MTKKQFKVHAEGYQDTDDMGYAIAPPVTYYHVGNSEIGFNFDTEREAKMLCEAWNKLVEENEQLEKENNKLKKETNELKQQFILLLKKLGKKNVQCSFCEHGEHYSELVDGYYEPRFICHKKGQEYTQRSFCEDWKIKVKE